MINQVGASCAVACLSPAMLFSPPCNIPLSPLCRLST
jgi:hypothetical protein